jgi:hypothetical protein
MPKQITVECAPQLAILLVQALRGFVSTHYPQGADECSIAARETLLDLAGRFEQELAVSGRCAYSSRVRAFLCEAVNSYTHGLERAQGVSWANRRASLIAVSRGLSNGQDFADAEARDRRAPVSGTG